MLQSTAPPPAIISPCLNGPLVVQVNEFTEIATSRKALQSSFDSHQETNKDEDEVLSQYMNSFDTFFAVLLRTSVSDYVEADKSEEKSEALWRALCKRGNLPIPTHRTQPIHPDAKAHFSLRASLVLEEARYAISTQVSKRWCPVPGKPPLVLHVTVTETVVRAHGITMLTLTLQCRDSRDATRRKYFSREELEYLYPCMVFECSSAFGPPSIVNTVLGCVLPCDKKRICERAEFDILIFRQFPVRCEDEWKLIPVDNFIAPSRQFAAVTGDPGKIPFLDALLGTSSNCRDQTKVSFADAGNVFGTNNCANPASASTTVAEKSNSVVRLDAMNVSQKKAVVDFLESPPKSISIIQGPPGTGKTTVIVATICSYLTAQRDPKEPRRRLAVCAPTNKAVSVLAARLLADTTASNINVVLVGDDDRLLQGLDKKVNPLRPFYIYTWQETVVKELAAITMFFDPKSDHKRKQSREDMLKKATNVRNRLFSSLLKLPSDVKSKVDELCTALQGRMTQDSSSLFHCAKVAHSAIEKLPNDAVLSDLMLSANVIFSTLCSAASNVMKGRVVDALIVDEAAAATEPDLYIPFHLKPSRLLIVGDPKQLPATVLSDRAKKLGLNISLQERLMNQCGYSFTRLDTQYRMAPEISKFPSQRFYENMIGNGENVMKPTYGKSSPSRLFNGSPYAFLQIDGKEENDKAGSKFNLDEANAVLDLVRKLVDSCDKTSHSSDRLRIITFYTAQVLLLQKILSENGLNDVLVATVDSSQGCEADIVIVSLVRSSFAGFLKDDRRMNVALTRSRHQLVCVGNVRRYPDMARAYTLHHLAEDVRKRNLIVVPTPAAKRIKTESP